MGGAVGGVIATLLIVCGVAGVSFVVLRARHQPRRKLSQEQCHEGMAIGNITYEGGKIKRYHLSIPGRGHATPVQYIHPIISIASLL